MVDFWDKITQVCVSIFGQFRLEGQIAAFSNLLVGLGILLVQNNFGLTEHKSQRSVTRSHFRYPNTDRADWLFGSFIKVQTKRMKMDLK